MQWLICPDFLHQLAAQARAVGRPTDAQLRAFAESEDAEPAGLGRTYSAAPPRGMSVAGQEAEIAIEGPLTPRALRFFSFLGNGSTYDDLIASLAFAAREPAIKRVTLRIDSPGGTVAGLFDALSALQAFEKPLTARVATAQSAAYAIAAMADSIEATSKASRVGSIGVVQSFRFWAGEETIHVTNSQSPGKRPDPRTPDGKAAIQRELDGIHALFVESIAAGRTAAGAPIAATEVTERFGAGGTLLAREALARRMIDSLPPSDAVPVRQRSTGASSAHATEPEPMRDRGDAVVECLRAEDEGRPPAEWALNFYESDTTTPHEASADPDRGDAVMRALIDEGW